MDRIRINELVHEFERNVKHLVKGGPKESKTNKDHVIKVFTLG